ncbi:Protein argonaute [Madurella mycetomatis]|uniref:Protein argonaute n=1 Tax=Madurella mycetomatis TaxID=100816 RepID=A0A175WCR1_9PEZI|nr:Protein argonaute [Madurella mycetomatis]
MTTRQRDPMQNLGRFLRESTSALIIRPRPTNQAGQEIKVGVNQFRVQNLTNPDVYQYDGCNRQPPRPPRTKLISPQVRIIHEPKSSSMESYRGHGGVIQRDPVVLNPPRGTRYDAIVSDVYQKCGVTNKTTPQIMFFILKDKNAMVYDRLKRFSDVENAALAQMLQAQHARRNQAQYCSDVCMKVNSKPGG